MMCLNKKYKKFMGLAIFILYSIIFSGCSTTPEATFSKNITPFIDVILSDVQRDLLLTDLSYVVEVDKLYSETDAKGEIIFISDEIENYMPEEQYAITQEISRVFFMKLTEGEESLSSIRLGEYQFTLLHGIGYSVWHTSNGTEYISSYFSLKKDGVEIYDNPINDLEVELENALGMPYDDWLKEQQSESKDIVVSSNDEDYWLAITAAQNLVKDELKSPLTARFPFSADNYSVVRNGSGWKVAGYVDAQNSFGVVCREYWITTFEMKDTGGTEYSITNYSVFFGYEK